MHIPINCYATTVPFPVTVWFPFKVLTTYFKCLSKHDAFCCCDMPRQKKKSILDQFLFIKIILGTVVSIYILYML